MLYLAERLSNQLQLALRLVRGGGGPQPLTFLAELDQFDTSRGPASGKRTIREIRLLPTHRRLDGIQRSHGRSERGVFPVSRNHLKLRERKNEILLPRRETRGRDPNKSSDSSGRIKALCLHSRLRHVFTSVVRDQHHPTGEPRILRRLDAIAQWKSKAVANPVEVVMSGMQHHTTNRHRPPQIHLHPLGRILPRLDGTVEPVGVARLRRLFPCRDATIHLRKRRSRASGDRLLQNLPSRTQLRLTGIELPTLCADARVDIVFLIRTIHRREHRLQSVVILLRNGIEFVVVALRALDGETVERLHGRRDHVVAIQMPRHLAIEFRLRNFGVTDQVPRSRGDEPQPLEPVPRARVEDIAGELLLDEPAVRFVGIETADDVVAIRPRVGPGLVLVVTVRLPVVDDIQPMPSPAFTILRGGEQTIHHPLIGQGRRVVDEGLDFLRCWRKADEIKGKASNQRSTIRLR